MKSILKVIALAIAAGFPVVAFAELAGLRVPAINVIDIAVIAFAIVIGAMVVLGDYARPTRSLITNIVPEPRSSSQRSTRAYGIRRGADVAKLAA